MKEVDELKIHYWELIENLLKDQRHDFLNEIQIIYGYIKLNKLDKAIDYINKVSKNAKICSKLSNLNCMELYIMMCDKFKKAKDLGLDINFEIYSNAKKEDFTNKNIRNMIDLFEAAIDRILDFMYNNSDFEEHIFYIEETCEILVLKLDLDRLNASCDLKEKFKLSSGKTIIEEEYLIYEIELI